LLLACALGLAHPSILGATGEPQPTREQLRRGRLRDYPQPLQIDLDLIDEGSRMFLRSSTLGWPNLRNTSPTPTLLLTPTSEYLMGHPAPPDSFVLVGDPGFYFMFVYGRDRTLPCEGSVSRPVFGAPTIVKASKLCTGEHATQWIFDFLVRAHRLYQLQSGEMTRLSRLRFANPERNENWKLRFPFPYRDPEVIEAVRGLGKLLSAIHQWQDPAKKSELLPEYYPKRARLQKLLQSVPATPSADDFLKYIGWSEGVARFAGYQTLEKLYTNPRAVRAKIRAYEDFVPYVTFFHRELRDAYQHFEHATGDSLTLEDLAMLGALTASCVDHFVADWRAKIMQPDVWLEDLMESVRPAP
jgi:hypothetical protein